jgi:tetratricopeptide (TPR) repeat protein
MQFLRAALQLAVPSKEYLVVQSIANCEYEVGNLLAAQSNAQRSQKLARLEGHMYHQSLGLEIEVKVCLEIGMLRKTIALCTQARELLCQCGLKGSDTDYRILSVMGETYCLKSEYSEAQEIYMQIKNATSDQQHLNHHNFAVLNLAGIAIITSKNLDHIVQTLDDQKKIFGAMPNSIGMASCDLVMSDFHLHKDHDTLAAQMLLLQHTQSVNREIANYSLEQLANLKYWGMTAIGWVPRWATVFLAHAFKCQNNLAVHKALSSMGHILLAMGDLNTAQSLFTVALEGFTWMDVHRSRAECMLHLGEISEQRGDLEKAISCFKAARPLFERSSQAKDVEHMDSLVRGLEEEIGHNTKVAYLSALNVPSQDIVRPLVEMKDGLANPVVV